MSTIQTRHWKREHARTLPPSRKAGSMVYDAHQNVLFLFGGGGHNDTWIWDGQSWRELHPSIVPPARTSASIAFDASQGHIVLFGGVDNHGNLLHDTWTWDGGNWRQHYTPDVPSARSGAAMAYDEIHQHVILFGGQTYGGRVGTPLNDTWTWDGSSWRALSTSIAPPPRLGASMAYHAATQHIVLFGGTAGHTTFNDTWTWDGQSWREALPATRPPARAWASMAYHPDIQRTLLVSGSGHDWSTGTPLSLSDTWAWDGGNWEPLAGPAPAGSYHSAAYHAARKAIIVYATSGGKPKLVSKAGGTAAYEGTAPAPLTSETWSW